MRAYHKKRYHETKEDPKVKSRREANKDRKKATANKWDAANKEKLKAYRKEWYASTKEARRIKAAAYRAANKENIKANFAKWRKRRYAADKAEGGAKFLNHKIRVNISRRIRSILGQNKSEASFRYVGCSPDKLRATLESTFQEYMNFGNFNRMHIDHRIPCAAFDMSNPVERQACFHYKNLQMMWAPDNVRKKDR